MKQQKTEAIIEAILFAMGNSVEVSVLAKALELEKEEVSRIVRQMMERYEEENRGIRILELENAFQLCTKTEY